MRLSVLLALAGSLYSQTLIVAHKRADSVGWYDSKTGKSLASTMVGVRPHEMAVSLDGKVVYVTNYGVNTWSQTGEGGSTISIIDPVARQVVGTIDLGRYYRPHGIEVGRRSGRLYVTADSPPSLLVIDPASRTVVHRFDVEQKAPQMAAVGRDETRACVANAGSGSVTVLPLNMKGTSMIVDTGGIPMGVAMTSDDRFCYVTTSQVTRSLSLTRKPAQWIIESTSPVSQPACASFARTAS